VRILIVEDELKVANALKQGLEGEHYDVAVATTGEEAFFQVSTAKFDLILLDWMLPGPGRHSGIDHNPGTRT
jgi:DNA-binding response OmpR family regulator